MFSSADILQIADVAIRVVFLLFLLYFSLFLSGEKSEMSAIFVLITKTTQTRPQVFSINGSIICNFDALLTPSVHYGKVLPNLVAKS